MNQGAQQRDDALPLEASAPSQGRWQFNLRDLFLLTTFVAVLLAVTPLGVVHGVLFVGFIPLWILAVVFLLRFSFTTWFLLGLTALLCWLSATYTHITGSIVLTMLVVAIWPIAALLMLSTHRTAKRRTVSRQALALAMFLLIVGSIVETQWPLRLAFAISRPSLDQLAEQIREHGRIREQRRAGLFVVRTSQVTADGVVCLWTEPDPWGNTGFVKCAPERAQRFNLWSTLQLSDDWQLVSED